MNTPPTNFEPLPACDGSALSEMILECADELERHRNALITLLGDAAPKRGRTKLKWYWDEETNAMFAEVKRLGTVIKTVRKHARSLITSPSSRPEVSFLSALPLTPCGRCPK